LIESPLVQSKMGKQGLFNGEGLFLPFG
jgi:hypothetical protein